MKLLTEITFEDVQIIVEEATTQGGKKNFFIEGVFLQADIQNKNKRIYPFDIMKGTTDKYIKEHIDTGRAMGELGHPKDPNAFTSINFERVSHKITSLKEDGKNFIGKAKIIDTPYGRIAKNLMEENVKFGVSSRALGSLKESNGAKIVNKDFMLITPADIVGDPSAPDAFVSNLMESKDWIWENGKLIELESEIKEMVNKESRKVCGLTEEKALEMFAYILKMI